MLQKARKILTGYNCVKTKSKVTNQQTELNRGFCSSSTATSTSNLTTVILHFVRSMITWLTQKKQSNEQLSASPPTVQCEVSLRLFCVIHHVNLPMMSWRLNLCQHEMAVSIREKCSLWEIATWTVYAWEVIEKKSYRSQYRRTTDQADFILSPNSH